MSLAPTLRRACIVFLAAFAVITAARLLRGHPFGPALLESAAWAAVSTLIFAIWDWRRRRLGEYCAICDGDPVP